MPYIKDPDVIYLAGACLGPEKYGVADLLLYDRVWQAYQDVFGMLHLKRSNKDMTAWEFDDIPDGLEGIQFQFPDMKFDKAGQPVIAFQKQGASGPEIWVRRVTVVSGVRTVIVEKVANGTHPIVYRDPEEDILVFYGDITDPANTVIKWRVQSEGWATERTVPIPVTGVKILQGVAQIRGYKFIVIFVLASDPPGELRFIESPRYPIPVRSVLGSQASVLDMNMYAVILKDFTSNLGAQAEVSFLDLPTAVTLLNERAATSLTVSNVVFINMVNMTLIEDAFGSKAEVSAINMYDVVEQNLSEDAFGAQAVVDTLDLIPV